MPDTFSQIYIHLFFSVKEREPLINSQWEERLYRYITGIVQKKGQKLIAINGTQDHIHIFIGLKPECCLSELVREIKKSSNVFINENRLSKVSFSWQEGYGAFSYSKSQIDSVVKYITKQKEHHKQKTFMEEYIEFLKSFEVVYDEK